MSRPPPPIWLQFAAHAAGRGPSRSGPASVSGRHRRPPTRSVTSRRMAAVMCW